MPDAPSTSTRERLLATTQELLARDGVSGVTLRRVAREAGVSHGAPLRHFPSLTALLNAVATEGFTALADTVDATVAGCGSDDPVDRLAAAGRGYVRFAVDNRGAFDLMFRVEHVDLADPALGAAATRAFDQLVGLVTEVQRTGWEPGEDPRMVAGSLWAATHGLAQLWLLGAYAAPTGAASLDAALDTMLRLLGAYDRKGGSR